MIPRDALEHWRGVTPWGSDQQVEQDLVLARAMAEVAQHGASRETLALKGGTCLHKLWMPTPWRYSEDLDYTIIGDAELDDIRAALAEVGARLGFQDIVRRRGRPGSKVVHDTLVGAYRDGSPFLLKVDIELDTGEPAPLLAARPHSIRTSWFRADTEVLSFSVEEILASKVAAVYRRRRPRDLFDIWAGMKAGLATPEDVAGRFHRYRPETWTARLAANNLEEKLARSDYMSELRSDLDAAGVPYSLPDVVMSAARLVDACTEATQPPRRWHRVVTSRSTAVDLLRDWTPAESSKAQRPGRSRTASMPAAVATGRLRPRIIAQLKRKPDASYDEIARAVGASTSYVAQIARQERLTRRR